MNKQSGRLLGAIWAVLMLGTLGAKAGLVCSTKKSGQLYRVGSEFKCEQEQFRSAVIQLQKANIREYKSEGDSLKVIQKTCDTYLSFVGTKVQNRYVKTVTWMSMERYKNHILRQSCENMEGRVFIGGQQTPDFDCRYSYLKHQSTSVLACIHDKGVVVGARNRMTRSDLGDVSHCDYLKGHCLTSEGVAVVWNPDKQEKEEFLEVGRFNATMVNENHLMIKELGIAFDLRQMEKINDNQFQNKEFKLKILYHQTREGGQASTTSEDTLDVFKREINAKLQFLADKLASPVAQVGTLCQAIELNQRLSRMLAVIDPTQFMRTVLNNTNLIAKAATSDYIMVWPCKEVDSISWRHIENKCYAAIPVKYRLEGQEVEGFMEPQSKTLYSEAAEIECGKAPKVIFDIKGEAFIYAAGNVPTRINHLEVKTLPILRTNMTDQLFTIPDTWVFNSTDLHHNDLENAIFSRLENRINKVENREIPYENVKQAKQKDTQEILRFLGFRGINMHHILEGLGIWMFRIMSVLGAYTFFDVYGRVLCQSHWSRFRRPVINQNEESEL